MSGTFAQSVPPAWAERLGYAGLLPFVGGAFLVWVVHAAALPYVALAVAGYAATIASFLGGIHWGLAMRAAPVDTKAAQTDRALWWGVMPSLVAWVAVVMPAYAGLVVLGVLIAVTYLVDRKHYPAWGVAGWLTLRFRLSAVAALSCFVAAAGC